MFGFFIMNPLCEKELLENPPKKHGTSKESVSSTRYVSVTRMTGYIPRTCHDGGGGNFDDVPRLDVESTLINDENLVVHPHRSIPSCSVLASLLGTLVNHHLGYLSGGVINRVSIDRFAYLVTWFHHSYLVEVDFSDVFGPLLIQDSIEVNCGELENDVSSKDAIELVYDEPAMIYSLSHSFLGPSSLVSPSLKLSKLTLCETRDAVELVECIDEETNNEVDELSVEDGDNKFFEDFSGDHIKVSSIGVEDFEVLKVVGQGAFGKVYQTKYRLYLILDFINRGYLFFQLHHRGLFREDLARIYAAEIVSVVSHLHANGIMHRDLKPENILLDADGHGILTDFVLAKQFDENTISNSLCGTVEYMAPEIITGKGHGKAADWWSVGVLLFEMLTGKPPFTGNREKTQQKILLHKDPSKHLGSGPTGSEEIKRCKWLKTINWRKLEAREIQPSFRPEIAGKQCIANFDKRWTDMQLTFSPASSPKTNTNRFTDFNFIRPAATNPFASE
ncbi:Serine/threonine-protein kinase AtPK1/AtPK6 [Hibiscus syriacus]|uniref:Serine/threonine-protein kinase AtPK1/AtPK6 n=1 Tax=Hibiscus syriacus TaxID=106335 RepID=A0A6A2XE19_HIBSY|nr:Serine/threonine-protein kinase AtPK1/AtPK6 [Hibiscus syriacus]